MTKSTNATHWPFTELSTGTGHSQAVIIVADNLNREERATEIQQISFPTQGDNMVDHVDTFPGMA